jgi:hypothetical protein
MKNLVLLFSLIILLTSCSPFAIMNMGGIGSSLSPQNGSALYNMNSSYRGSITFKNKKYSGIVKFKKDTLSVGEDRFYSFNKDISNISITEDGKRLIMNRVGANKLLHRVLLDTLDLQMYDLRIFDFNAKIDISSTLLVTPSDTINFRNSCFRNRNGKIKAFLNRSKLNSTQKEFLEKWLRDNI